MNQQQYQNFLNDPTTLLNVPSVVHRIRLNNLDGADNATSRAVDQNGVFALRYRYSVARVTSVWLRYDTTPIQATSALWVEGRTPVAGEYIKTHAYYLQWGVDQAYAIELGADAPLFFTAELTGCGILVFSAPNKLIVVHHNIQVPNIAQTFFERLFESPQAHADRSAANAADVRTQKLFELAEDIISTTPGITRGKLLGEAHYPTKSCVFGIKRSGRWRLFINRPVGAIYQTDLLYEA
jgi:hypothetical protein